MSTGAARVVPLARARHGGWSWLLPGRDMGFARGLRGVPVEMGELAWAAIAFPLVLRRARDGALGIEAMLRLGDGPSTPFVGPDGAWRAPCLPRALRHAPFDTREVGAGRLVLLIDEASPLVRQDRTGQPFFAADGSPDPALAPVQAGLRAAMAERAATRAACLAVEAAGLLRPFGPEGERFVVDADRFAALDASGVAALHKSGALLLIHAQILSMGHCDWLRRAEGLSPDMARARAAPERADRVAGFLSALYADQQREETGLHAAANPDDDG
ncbi:MAG: SapC family protein [Roseovarius sp.]|nr:SapC family protein [Roseovarius sp.]